MKDASLQKIYDIVSGMYKRANDSSKDRELPWELRQTFAHTAVAYRAVLGRIEELDNDAC